MRPHQFPEVMNTDEVAAYLDVGTTTIERWRDTEGFPVAKIGGTVRFTKTSVNEWIASRVQAGAPALPSETTPRRKGRQHA